MNDARSQMGQIVVGDVSSMHRADYTYLGLGPASGLLPVVNSLFTLGVLEADYTEPDMKYTLTGTAGGTDPDIGDVYRGFDRFGRVKDYYWCDYGGSKDPRRRKHYRRMRIRRNQTPHDQENLRSG